MDNNYLSHHGILGQKWGVRRFQNPDGTRTEKEKKRLKYSSTGIRGYIAKKNNEKIDKNFKKWKEGEKRRDTAIELGKKANKDRMAYENDKKNKDLKKAYKSSKKEYGKALRQNTTYRKGTVKEAVGKDASRKYLSEGKKYEKLLKNDPDNKELKKKYNSLMTKHDIERKKARNAQLNAEYKMRIKANIKRSMTIAAKDAAVIAATSGGIYAVNKILDKKDVRYKGHKVRLSGKDIANAKNIQKWVNFGRKMIF